MSQARWAAAALAAGLCGCAGAWSDFKQSITPPDPASYDQSSRYRRAYPGSYDARRSAGVTCVASGAVSQCTERYSDGTSRRFTCRGYGIYRECR